MKLSYPYIFRDSGGMADSEQSGFRLSAAFTRFLLSVASDYYTFYDGDVRTSLADSELQIIESGLKELSMPQQLSKIVFDGTLAENITPPAPGAVNLPITPAILDGVAWDVPTSLLTIETGGLYQVSAQTVNWPTPTGSNMQALLLRVNGVTTHATYGQRWNPTHSLDLSWCLNLSEGDTLQFRYANQSAESTTLSAPLTRAQVVYLG